MHTYIKISESDSMIGDQVPNIKTNETQIDRLKKKKSAVERQAEAGSTATTTSMYANRINFHPTYILYLKFEI